MNKKGFIGSLITLLILFTVIGSYLIYGNVHEQEANICSSFYNNTNTNYIGISYFKNDQGQCCTYGLVNNSLGVVCG